MFLKIFFKSSNFEKNLDFSKKIGNMSIFSAKFFKFFSKVCSISLNFLKID